MVTFVLHTMDKRNLQVTTDNWIGTLRGDLPLLIINNSIIIDISMESLELLCAVYNEDQQNIFSIECWEEGGRIQIWQK